MASPVPENAASATFSRTNTLTVTMTTSGVNRACVVAVHMEASYNGSVTTNGATAQVGSISGGGLSWQKRSGHTWTGAGIANNLEVWEAFAAAQQTSATVTVNLVNNGSPSGTIDDACIVFFAAAGCNSVAPWDSNVAVPAVLDGTTSNASVGGISTTSPDDLLVSFYGSSGGASVTSGAGWVNIANPLNGGGANISHLNVQSQSVSAPQSGVSATWSQAANPWGVIADALTADAVVVNPPLNYFSIVG